MIPRTQDELIYYLRSLLSSKLKDIQKNLPVHIEWASNEAAILMIAYYMYINNNNVSKAARDLKIARTTLAYHISKHPEIKQEIAMMMEEDRIELENIRRLKTRR
jgi:transcriptional regulator with PAS, ATPase and Fis domain